MALTSEQIEALERLSQLRLSGTLTDEEFQVVKTTVMDAQGEPSVADLVIKQRTPGWGPWHSTGSVDPYRDLVAAAGDIVISRKLVDVAMFERLLDLEPDSAERLMDVLEEGGVISAPNGEKTRNVLLAQAEWDLIRPGGPAPGPPPSPHEAATVEVPLDVRKVGDNLIFNRPVKLVSQNINRGIIAAGLKADWNERQQSIRTSGGYWKYNGCSVTFTIRAEGEYTVVHVDLHVSGLLVTGDKLMRDVMPLIYAQFQTP